jgi:hypothetical protein
MPGQANQWRRRYQAGELLHPFPSQGRVNMELRIESMFPADEETEREHLLLLGAS